jgi:hypothetical protein
MASRKRGGFQTWTNASGYQKFRDPRTGRAEYTHIRVAEKKVGGPIGAGREVHHIDGNKNNNRPSNLRVMSEAQHRAIHRKGK